MEFFISCPFWLQSILKKEIQFMWYKTTEVTYKWVYFTGDETAIARVNINSRVGSKLFLILGKWKVQTFEDLFQLVWRVDWKKWLPTRHPIKTTAFSKKSILESTPSIQAIAKKSIVKSILWGDGMLTEDEGLEILEVRIGIEENYARILLNTTGDGLHRRWYRVDAWEAPIKENLAAWLVLRSNWKFSTPIYDIFCGSGTILIEAAMIAKNIAPWLNRTFAFENFFWIDSQVLDNEMDRAKSKVFTWREHKLIGSDIDSEMIKIAKENAKAAGVWEYIRFAYRDFVDYKNEEMEWTLLINPPYGERLDVNPQVYEDIAEIFKKNEGLNGGLITSFEEFEYMITNKWWKKKKIYNWSQECSFYQKIK